MTLRKRADVISRREGDKTLIFQSNSRDLRILNSTSTFIWERAEEMEAEEIAVLLAERYELPEEHRGPEQARELVSRHLELLKKAQLLEATA